MYYKKIRNIARLVFTGSDCIENVEPYPTISFDLGNLNTNIQLTENSFLVLEYVCFDCVNPIVIRCNKSSSRMNYWDSSQGVSGDPIIFSNKSLVANQSTILNPDPTIFFKFPIDKTFFNNPIIKFSFDVPIDTTINKNKLSMTFIIYDEEDVWDNTKTEFKKEDYINGKKFPVVY